MEFGDAIQDYAKAIYKLEVEAGRATTNALAEQLGVAPASVTGMLRRLSELGLVTYERYRGVRLTDAGRKAALRTIRRHRVIEAYLVKALGYPWDRVHPEAERLEHAALASGVHRVDERLVAVAEVDRAPARRLRELAVGPGAVRQLERHERAVLLEGHVLRLYGFGRHGASPVLVGCRAGNRLGKHESSWPEGTGASASTGWWSSPT